MCVCCVCSVVLWTGELGQNTNKNVRNAMTGQCSHSHRSLSPPLSSSLCPSCCLSGLCETVPVKGGSGLRRSMSCLYSLKALRKYFIMETSRHLCKQLTP